MLSVGKCDRSCRSEILVILNFKHSVSTLLVVSEVIRNPKFAVLNVGLGFILFWWSTSLLTNENLCRRFRDHYFLSRRLFGEGSADKSTGFASNNIATIPRFSPHTHIHTRTCTRAHMRTRTYTRTHAHTLYKVWT